VFRLQNTLRPKDLCIIPLKLIPGTDLTTVDGSAESLDAGSVEAKRPFVFYVLISDRAVLVAQIQKRSYNHSNAHADREECAVRRKAHEHSDDYYPGNDQPCSAFYADGHSWQHGSNLRQLNCIPAREWL